MPELGKCRRHSEHRRRAPRTALESEQSAEIGLANSHSVLQHGLEHRLQLAGRTRDDAQHLRCRGLLLQRLGEIVGALAQLVEQPRVLDRDDRLVGEILQQRDLLLGERPHLHATDQDRTDGQSFRNKGVASVVLCPYCRAYATPSGNSRFSACRSGTWTVVRSITARPATQSRFNGRAVPTGQFRDDPYLATDLSMSPSTLMISASVTSSSRAALSAMPWSAASALPGELDMTRSTSAVAVCCSSASARCFRDSASSRVRWSSCFWSSATGRSATACGRQLLAGLELRCLEAAGFHCDAICRCAALASSHAAAARRPQHTKNFVPPQYVQPQLANGRDHSTLGGGWDDGQCLLWVISRPDAITQARSASPHKADMRQPTSPVPLGATCGLNAPQQIALL